VATSQIYKGSIAFIVLQLIMVAAVITFPGLVIDGIDKGVQIDADKALQELGVPQKAPLENPTLTVPAPAGEAGSAPAAAPTGQADDPMKAIQDALKREGEAGKK
jgi:hypothetical protein